MQIFMFLFVLHFVVLVMLIFVLIFGNIRRFRNMFIGKAYRFLRIRFPVYLKSKFPSGCGKLKFPFAIFYFAIYVYFFLVFVAEVVSILRWMMPNHYRFLVPFSYFLTLVPWILLILLRLRGPGVINKNNVSEYLKKYPYDNVIYKSKTCPTDGIPVVPRSRYCRFTGHRIPFV